MNTMISPARPLAWKPNFAGSQAVSGAGVGEGVGLGVGGGVGVGETLGDGIGVGETLGVGPLVFSVGDGGGTPPEPHPATRVTTR
jgi:hypothetical protein